MNILITGATGFIGSHITNRLVKQGHKIFAICRNKSNFAKCESFINKVNWLNNDEKNWTKKIENTPIDLFIHTAWSGVSSAERNDWDLQLSNFKFSQKMIDLAISLKAQKIICLGSQAEYGQYDYKVTENHVPKPIDAYGATKLLTLYYLQNQAIKYNFSWYWVRVFSIIGENENKNWLLSQVIEKLRCGQEIELTAGEQVYDYMYIKDFVISLEKLISCTTDKSGIYNICTGQPTMIRPLLQIVAEKLEKNTSKLKFGALPYRLNQNMYMVGSPVKFEQQFGKLEFIQLNNAIEKIIKSIIER